MITEKFIAPILSKAHVTEASQLSRALAPIRENRMAKGGVETAVWDLEARLACIELKIRPGNDVRLLEAVRSRYASITLSVDANSAYSLEHDLDLLTRLDQYDLLMIEQPLAAGDLLDHASLQRSLRTAICLDESRRAEVRL